MEVPTEGTATVSGSAADSKPAEDPDLTKDLDALAKTKPLFVYYYVALTSQPMDTNYKFSRKFEMSVLGQETIEFLNKNFICKKVELPADADMKIAKNHARIEIWSPTGKKVGLINTDNEATLNKTPFLGFMQVRIAKSAKLVAEEIARVQKLRKEKEEVGKKQTAKQGE